MRNSKKHNNKRVLPYAHFEEPIPRLFPLGNKAIDQTGNPSYASTGSVSTITFPAQGTTYSQRVADRCRLTGYEYRTDIFLNSTDTNNPIRIIIFQEIGLSTATPTVASVLQVAAVTSSLAYNAGKLYHILHDEVMTLNQNSSHSMLYKIVKPKLKITDIQFMPTTTTPFSGQLYVLTIGGTANLPTANLYSRIWFADTD
jgi:hypothetical protein